MRRIWPIYGAQQEYKSDAQRGLGKKETAFAGSKFSVLATTIRNGKRIKTITITNYNPPRRLSTGNAGIPDAIRIVRMLTASGVLKEDKIEIFLESGWIHIYPGDEPGRLFYSPHLLADYNLHPRSPAYLDTIQLPGPTFIVRGYTPWMTDNVIYKAESRRQNDALNNRYAQGGRLGLFTRCCLSTKLDTSLFLAVLESPPSWALSYFIYVDTDLTYWFVKVTQTQVSKAQILFWGPGQAIHTYLKEAVGAGNKISQSSAAHASLRKMEAYLFATARNTTSFSAVDTISVLGSSVYYGWNANWDGTQAAMVTMVWEPGVTGTYEGIRSRLNTLSITDNSATLAEKENELGTLEISDVTVYYPDVATVPGRMQAWFPKALTDTWDADLETDMPFHAWYLEDDSLCEVWFKRNVSVYQAPVDFGVYAASLGSICGGAGVHESEEFSAGGIGANTHANGFYIKNSPGEAIDLFMEIKTGEVMYELSWDTEANGGGGSPCLDDAKNGFSGLENHDCTGGFIAANRSGHCCGVHHYVTITCGDAHWTRDYYNSRNQQLGSVMMFNFAAPDSATLIRWNSESWSGHTNTVRNWTNQAMEWTAPGSGSGKQGYPWNATFPGELFPELLGRGVCTTDPVYSCDCLRAIEDPTTSTGKAASGLTVAIEHYVITQKEVITILTDTYSSWAAIGFYDDLSAPAFAYPYINTEVSCRTPIENYIATGDFLSYPAAGALPLITDMAIDSEHLGTLTIPVGRV